MIKKNITPLTIALLVLIIISPILLLVFNVINYNESEINSIINMRQFIVLIKTVSFSILVAFLSSIFGFYIAFVTFINQKKMLYVFIFSFLFISIPPYIFALSFIEFTKFLNLNLITGFKISVFVQTIYYIPFTSIIFYLHINNINKSYFDSSLIEISNLKSKLVTVKEFSFPTISFSLLLITLLSISNYTIPSIFAFNTYPIEIMSIFANTNNYMSVIITTLPILLISIIISFAIYKIFSKNFTSFQIESNNLFEIKNKYDNKILDLFLFLVVVIQTFSPIVFLLFDYGSLKAILPSIINNYQDILYTIIVITFSSLLIIIISTFFAYTAITNKKLKSFFIILSISLLSLPSSFVGISVNHLYNSSFFNFLFYSPILIIHAFIIRFLPISFFIIFYDFNKYEKSYFHAALLNTNNKIQIFKNIIFPNSFYNIIYGFLAVSILSIGEVGASIIVMPPGKSTLAVIIYNYLHYGSSDSVKGLSLFIFILLILASFFIITLIKIKRRSRYEK